MPVMCLEVNRFQERLMDGSVFSVPSVQIDYIFVSSVFYLYGFAMREVLCTLILLVARPHPNRRALSPRPGRTRPWACTYALCSFEAPNIGLAKQSGPQLVDCVFPICNPRTVQPLVWCGNSFTEFVS